MLAIATGARKAGVPRLLVVGGAGSLKVAPGTTVLDSTEFPAAWRPAAEGIRDVLAWLRATSELDWTFLSPSAYLQPGQRTGRLSRG